MGSKWSSSTQDKVTESVLALEVTNDWTYGLWTTLLNCWTTRNAKLSGAS